MRITFAPLVLLVFGACAPTHRAPAVAPATPQADDLERKTVALVATHDALARPFCSGVWVADDAVLTAAHCVSDVEDGAAVAFAVRDDLDTAEAPVTTVSVVRWATLAQRDETHDLALLRVRLPPEHRVAHVAAKAAFVGEIVQTMGHPLGMWWSFSTGEVAGVRRVALDPFGDALWYVQSTAPISPGNSGGGLFDDSGDLLGICHAYMPRGENLNLYVHSTYVKAFLDTAIR